MKLFTIDHNQVLQDLKKEFDITSDIDEADAVVLWTDVTFFERAVVNLAQSKKLPVYVMQHGRKGTSRYYPPFNEKIQADKLLVWGEFDRKSLIEAGQDPKKIEVVGQTVLSHLKPRKEHKGTNIVFCPEHWDNPVEENRKTRNKLRQLKGYNIITKIIESQDPKDFDNPIQSTRWEDDHLDICAEVLITADLVVGISESTFELMAQAMDIPVVIMEEWTPKAFGGDERYATYRRVISNASKKATLVTLLDTIKDQLKNPNELKRQRRQVCIDEGGFNFNALEEIKNVLYKK